MRTRIALSILVTSLLVAVARRPPANVVSDRLTCHRLTDDALAPIRARSAMFFS